MKVFETDGVTELLSFTDSTNPMGALSTMPFTGTPGVANRTVWSLDGFNRVAVPEPSGGILSVS